MIRRPPRSTPLYSSAASDVYKRQHVMLGITTCHNDHTILQRAEHATLPETVLHSLIELSELTTDTPRTSCLPKHTAQDTEPVTQRVPASSLTFRIRHVCCHNNETSAPIANPPHSAQLGGTRYQCSKLQPGPCSSVAMRHKTDTHTRADTHTSVSTIHFTWLRLMQNVRVKHID